MSYLVIDPELHTRTIVEGVIDPDVAALVGAHRMGVPDDRVLVVLNEKPPLVSTGQTNCDGDVAELGDPSGLKGREWVEWHERSFRLPRPCGCDLGKRRVEWAGAQAVCLGCGAVVNEAKPQTEPMPGRRDQPLVDSEHDQDGSTAAGAMVFGVLALGCVAAVLAVVAWIVGGVL